jgi:hypothetical protein
VKRSVIAVAVILLGPAHAFASAPKVTLKYAEMFDTVCSKETQYKIDPKWQSELMKRVPEFQYVWDQSGGDLLSMAHEYVGKDFDELEYAVALSVCSFPSMSNPLLINMRYSLASFTTQPVSRDVTVGLILHEILHRYIEGRVNPADSPMLKKYKAENETVRSHLHLFALMKAVYIKLDKQQLLQNVIARDQALPNGAYKRAWEIVNKIEDYKVFVRELQN